MAIPIPSLELPKPYLLRAFYDWLLDQQLTPYVVIDATFPNVKVPMEFARNGKIILNIGSLATRNLHMSNHEMLFDTSFNGIPHAIKVPIKAILAIYAKEHGAGTVFAPEPVTMTEVSHHSPSTVAIDTKTPKRDLFDANAQSESKEVDSDLPPKPPRRGGPTLKIVK